MTLFIQPELIHGLKVKVEKKLFEEPSLQNFSQRQELDATLKMLSILEKGATTQSAQLKTKKTGSNFF